MTKTEFQQLKTPVILHTTGPVGPATGPIDYFRVTKIPIGTRPIIHFDLLVGKIKTTKYIRFYLKSPRTFQRSPHFTKVSWPRAKREMLNLLLGPSK